MEYSGRLHVHEASIPFANVNSMDFMPTFARQVKKPV